MKPHHVQVRKLANRGTEIAVDGIPMTVVEDGLLYEQRIGELPTVTLQLIVDGPIMEKVIQQTKDTRVEIIRPYVGGFK